MLDAVVLIGCKIWREESSSCDNRDFKSMKSYLSVLFGLNLAGLLF
jgi:hypothetical protein